MFFKLKGTFAPIKRLFTALTGTSQKTHKHVTEKLQDFATPYVGRWYIINQLHNIQHTLVIDSDLQLTLDQSPFPYELISISPSQFVIRDSKGYQLTLTCQHGVPVTLHDEADDRTYAIKK